jgi:Uma2 family endonuclease
MSATVATPPAAPAGLLTAEEFFRRHGGGGYELIDGRAVEVPMPGGRHGKIRSRVSQHLLQFADAGGLGHVMSNDTLVITKRGPDSARGSDVCFVSYARLPKDRVPDGPLEVVPELVFEVRSPTDRWIDVVGKAVEYIRAGVTAVVILDPRTASATVYRDDVRSDIFERDDTLTVPDVLPGFAVPVARFFE